MATKRKRSDPQATRYRIALTALAKAERRKKAAEAAIRALRAKVRRYERALPPERRAEIHAGTKQRKATEAMRKERWSEALTALRTAGRLAGDRFDVMTLYTKPKGGGNRGRRYGMAVELREGRCLVWDFRDGFKSGLWKDRENRRALTPIVEWRAAA